MAWVKNDNYNETRTFPKYTVPKDPSKWKPTPPDYMDGIEPHWREIRTLVIDSSGQFPPLPPTPFSTKKNSQFYKETMEVYDVVKNATEEQLAIAEFWDCNPYVSHHTGHVMYATKKITPGGHWMGITNIATKKADADMMKTLEAYTRVSISLFDAFISCWDEKYRSNLVRPETVINSYIDEDWQPTLQTPPFPEHTSGHSVISTASAVALTDLFGDNFSFLDSTEVEYGLPPRSFDSFMGASNEAAVSRLYGGIHYRPAIDYGVDQGKKVGNLIVERIKTSPNRTPAWKVISIAVFMLVWWITEAVPIPVAALLPLVLLPLLGVMDMKAAFYACDSSAKYVDQQYGNDRHDATDCFFGDSIIE